MNGTQIAPEGGSHKFWYESEGDEKKEDTCEIDRRKKQGVTKGNYQISIF